MRGSIMNLHTLIREVRSEAIALMMKLQYKEIKCFAGFKRLIGPPN
jgi:hypothetical protein